MHVENDRCGAVRSVCYYMLAMFADELQLFLKVFFEGNCRIERLYEDMIVSMLDELSTPFVDAVRPIVFQSDAFDELAQMVSILKNEVLQSQAVQTSAIVLTAAQRSLTELLGNAQERLVYRCHAFIATCIRSVSPFDQTDAESEAETTFQPQMYPPVRATLKLMSQMYDCVETATFASIAHDAVDAALTSLASKHAELVSSETRLQADLHSIANLLTVREHLVPFDVELTDERTTLDFSPTTKALYELLRHATQILRWSADNPVLTFLRQSVPRVHRQIVDSKQVRRLCDAQIGLPC